MSRSKFVILAPLLAVTAAAALAAPPSTGRAATALETSTGRVEVALETLPIVESKPWSLPEGETRATIEGTVSGRGPVEVVLSPVPSGMLDLGVAAFEGRIWMSLYRDEERKPLIGSAPADQTTRFIGNLSDAKRIRIVVHHPGDETRFRVQMRVASPIAE